MCISLSCPYLPPSLWSPECYYNFLKAWLYKYRDVHGGILRKKLNLVLKRMKGHDWMLVWFNREETHTVGKEHCLQFHFPGGFLRDEFFSRVESLSWIMPLLLGYDIPSCYIQVFCGCLLFHNFLWRYGSVWNNHRNDANLS